MNQSSAADQNKSETKITGRTVKLPNQIKAVTLLQINAIENLNKPTLSSSSVSPLPTVSAPGTDLSVKYRSILEELLRLRIDLVTKSISSAIKSIIVVEISQTTSDDWLLVIFKALERILDALDVRLIYSNESYLAAISRLLYRLIDTSKLLELVENRSETKNFAKYFSQKMAAVLNQVSVEAVYKSAQEIFDAKRRSSFAQILELLTKSLIELPVSSENALSIHKLSLWFDHVVPLVFDADVDIQQNAINAVGNVIPLMMVSKHQSHPDWQKHRTTIISKYAKEIATLFQKDNNKWHLIWCHCVQILDIEIPRSATTLNAYLGIVEPALRSNVPERRAEGYLCWRVLLGVLVRHNRLNSEKRLKLACTPLKSLQAKTAEIAINKFHAWWYVLCNVVDNMAGYNSMVFEPFLQFCFGPLAIEPNIRSEIVDTTAQVKRFPDVSLMAIATFVRILGASTVQTDTIFKKYRLDRIDRAICTEKQFQNALATLIINACGEATFMLTNLNNEFISNVDCNALANQLWHNLLTLVNRNKCYDHLNLMLTNVKQLLITSAKAQINERKESTFTLVTNIVEMLADTAIAFENSADIESQQLQSHSHAIIVCLLEIVLVLPATQTNDLLAKVLATPHPSATVNYVQMRTHLLHQKFFAVDVHAAECDGVNVSAEQIVRIKFRIWLKWFGGVASWWRANSVAVQKHNENDLKAFIDPITDCLHWPLTALIDKKESMMYAKSLNELAQLISAAVDKKSFCERSAKSIRRIIALPQHCVYINNIVAVLFDFMNYDYKGMHDAPVDALDLCVALINLDRKIVFQDLNPIALAIIDYYKVLAKSQRTIIETKLREVMASIEKTKTEMRVDPKLITSFNEVIEDSATIGANASTLPKSNNNKRAANGSTSELIKSRKINSDAEFIVVDKVWSLQPNRLTEHQKEKLKERRCDIPALYNNLSQSQDSVSLKEWTPKTLMPAAATAIATATETETETETETATVMETETASATATPPAPPSVASKLNATDVSVKGKKQDENVATNNTKHNSSSDGKSRELPRMESTSEPIVAKKLKLNADDVADDEEEKKKRLERELSRIHIDAVVDAVPFAESMARRTRSSRSDSSTTQHSAKASKVNRTPNLAKARKQSSKIYSSDSDASDEIQSSQPPQCETPPPLPNKRKIRSQSMHTETATPIELDSIEATKIPDDKHIETANAVPTTSPTSCEIQPTVAMECAENETDLAKEETIAEQTLPPSTTTLMEVDACKTVDEKPTATVETEIPAAESGAQYEECYLPPTVDAPIDENDIITSGKSYMSALVFDDTIALSLDNGNESIVTSPKIDDKKNQEFLNDTLNISPIVSDPENVTTNNETDATAKCSLISQTATIATPKNSFDHAARKLCASVELSTPNDYLRSSNESNLTAQDVPPSMLQKNFRSSQSSTPIQSNQSPVSSKFKPQVMGRGAQLLKMINSNKNNINQQQRLCGSPTVTMSATHESSTVVIATTSSPTINKLQTAPMCSGNLSTPEPMTDVAKVSKSDLLTFSRALPSPYESPRFSILKRKASKEGEDDSSIHSPAHKRKRVSFNFPLTETKEFLIDDEMAPSSTLSATTNAASHREIDAHSVRSPTPNNKYKLKLKKRIDSVTDIQQKINTTKTAQFASESTTASSSMANKLFRDQNDGEVSVEHIKEYLEMDSTAHREKQKKLNKEARNSAANTSVINSAVASKSSDDETLFMCLDTQASSPSPPSPTPSTPATPITLNSFSDAELFHHLFGKFHIAEIFNKYEECKQETIDAQLARFFTHKISTIMSTDEKVKVAVLDELAEKHSTAFLDHAVTENLCSTICDRLIVSSKDGIIDYVADQINTNPDFAAPLLNRITTKLLRNRAVNASSVQEKHEMLSSIVAQLEPNEADSNDGINALLLNIFAKYNFTANQFEEFTKLYILRKYNDAIPPVMPPQTSNQK